MRKVIRLTESELHGIIESAVKKLVKEDVYMSDDSVNKQYEGMGIDGFRIEHLRHSDGWEGSFELEFPNADGVDYDNYMVNNFIAYDDEGMHIAWDRWMPNEQTKALENFIRKEIGKRQLQRK